MDTSGSNSKVLRHTGLTLLLLLLLAVNLVCSIQIIRLTSQQTQLKQDYALVNSLRYGLFSMEAWKVHFEHIVSKSILNLKLSPQDQITLKSEIEKIVRVMISQADSILTKNQKTLGSKVRKVAYKALVDIPRLSRKSPEFAQAVMEEITKQESLEQIRRLALNQLNRYAGQTRNLDDSEPTLSDTLKQYQVTEIDAFNRVVQPQIQALQQKIRWSVRWMICSVLAILGLGWGLRKQLDLQPLLYRFSLGFAALVLCTSLAVPMLDIDARIQSVHLLLLGEPIQFTNQVLFYRSKSLLEVVRVLLVSGQLETFFVGTLLLAFSVIFPLAKLTSAWLCLSPQKAYHTNKWISFFAYNSGKWSMADVWVVAIFMAYIGFNKILDDQLKGLNVTTESWQMITTNQTSLQPGFSLFFTFVIVSLVLSEILKKVILPKRQPVEWFHGSPSHGFRGGIEELADSHSLVKL